MKRRRLRRGREQGGDIFSPANYEVWGSVMSSPSGVRGGARAKKTNLVHSKHYGTLLLTRYRKSWEQHLKSWGAVCHENWAADSSIGYSKN